MDLVSFVKKNKWLHNAYYISASFLVRFLKVFVKADDRLILFVSFGGRYFNDNPKILYDAMLKDERFKGYKMVWAFLRPDQMQISTPKININSMTYVITALKARCWITNVAIERGLSFTGKKTYYFFTTHTTLPKLSGYDNGERTIKSFQYNYDCSCAQSDKEKKMQESMFGLNAEQILLSGYPKNDLLCHYSESQRKALRSKLNLSDDVKVILYAPTFRDAFYGAMKCPVDFKKWESLLGHEFVVLFRAHPVVANETNIDSSSHFVYDVSSYPESADLMIISDILISDYSGIFFEYAVMKKPMFCYAYDYDEYIKTRKLYFDIRKMIPGGMMSEQELLGTIKSGYYSEYETLWQQFRDDYVSEYGRATEICLNKIAEEIKK